MGSTDELFAAIEAGDVEDVRRLLYMDASLAGARDAEGVSALMRARYRLDMAMSAAILAATPPLDVFEAASFGDLDRLTALIDQDPGEAAATSADGFSALHFAAFFGKLDAARLLVERGADVDVGGRGWMTGTPLHSAASANHTDVVRILLDAGADPNAPQSGGWTPLHSAAQNGNVELVELLLAHGANPSATNDDGADAVWLAEKGGNNAVAAILAAKND